MPLPEACGAKRRTSQAAIPVAVAQATTIDEWPDTGSAWDQRISAFRRRSGMLEGESKQRSNKARNGTDDKRQ